MKRRSKTAEVAWGQAKEKAVMQRWAKARQLPETHRIIKSRDFQDFDFLILDKTGFPYCYLEIKVRRMGLGMFNDAIFPARKHDYALRLQSAHAIRFLAAVEYTDALVEVDLAAAPSALRDIQRSDRTTAVKHAVYDRPQLTVLEGDEEGDDDDDVAR